MASDDEHEYQQVKGSDDLFVRDDDTLVKETADGYEEKGALEDGGTDYGNIHIAERDDGYEVAGMSTRAAEQAGLDDAAGPDVEEGGDTEYVEELDDPQEVKGSDSLVVDDGTVYIEKEDGYKAKAEIEDGTADVGAGVTVTAGDDGYEAGVDAGLDDGDYTTGSGSEVPGRRASGGAGNLELNEETEEAIQDHYDQQQQIQEIREELEGLKEGGEEEGSGEFDTMEDLLKMHKVLDNSGLKEFKSVATAAYLINQYKSQSEASERESAIDELQDRIDQLEQGIYGTGEETDAETGADEGGYGGDGLGGLIGGDEGGSGEEGRDGFFSRMKGYKDRLLGGDEEGDEAESGRDVPDDHPTLDDFGDSDEDSGEGRRFEYVGESDDGYEVMDEEGNQYLVQADEDGVQSVEVIGSAPLQDAPDADEIEEMMNEQGYTADDLRDYETEASGDESETVDETTVEEAVEDEGYEVEEIRGGREIDDGKQGVAVLDDGTEVPFVKGDDGIELQGRGDDSFSDYVETIEGYEGLEEELDEPGMFERFSSGVRDYLGSSGGGYLGGLFGGGEEESPEPTQEEIEQERDGFMEGLDEATGAAENVGEQANEAAGENIVDESAAPGSGGKKGSSE